MPKSNNFAVLERIETDLEKFIRGVKRCETECLDPANFKDAIMRFSRLRERYFVEKSNLSAATCKALSKVFEEDMFIKRVMNLRQVKEHVKIRGGLGS